MGEREVIYEDHPEIWDEGFEDPRIKPMIDYATENLERKGSCKRCGECCHWNNPKTQQREHCKHLVDGYICSIWNTDELPLICKIGPVKPTSRQEKFNGNYILPDGETEATPEGCGFYWVSK